MINPKTIKKQFEAIVSENIARDGIENFMEWLSNETDFFQAPASTRYHGSYEGGLAEHSLNVYNQLVREMEQTLGADWLDVYSPETVAIVALFHDICKIDRYIIEEAWRKDDNGQWESYERYNYNREKPEMGHGAQSVFYLQKFIQLSEEEAQAIYWHMGAYDISPYSTLAHCSETFKHNPLAFLVHRADMGATYMIENEVFSTLTAYSITEKEEPETVEEVEEEETPKSRLKKTARRKKAEKVGPEPEDDKEEEKEEEPKARISRRKKATKKEEPEKVEEQEEEAEEKQSKIRMPRKGKATKKAEPVEEEPEEVEEEAAPESNGKTYYFYNEEDDYYYKAEENEPENESDILIDEEEYLDAMSPILEEDFFYKLEGKAYKLAEGERLPEEYDEETWEPITEEEYKELTEAPKKTVRASRRKPTPSRRPKK